MKVPNAIGYLAFVHRLVPVTTVVVVTVGATLGVAVFALTALIDDQFGVIGFMTAVVVLDVTVFMTVGLTITSYVVAIFGITIVVVSGVVVLTLTVAASGVIGVMYAVEVVMAIRGIMNVAHTDIAVGFLLLI